MNKAKAAAAMILLAFSNNSGQAQWIPTQLNPAFDCCGDNLDACDSLNVAAVYPDGGIAVTTDGGTTWTMKPRPSWYGTVDVSITDAAHFWIATGGGQIFASSDSGTTWTLQYGDTNATEFMDYVKMFDSMNGIAMGDARIGKPLPAVFLRTTDGGLHWDSMNKSFLIGAWSGDTWRRISFVSPRVGYFYESGINPQSLMKTTDSGASWTYAGFTGMLQVLKFCDQNLGLIYSRDSVARIYRTTNGGATWEQFQMAATGWGNDIEFLPGDPGKVWMTDYNKLYFSDDTGRTWREEFVDTATLRARAIKCVDAHHAWMSCDGSVIYRTEHAEGIVVAVRNNQRVPEIFRLSQNYPNPFNPSTEISYQTSEFGMVVLKVYDVLGREIATLVNERQNPGSHTVTFDAGTHPSGVYFYRLTAGNYACVKKMVVLK